MKERFFDIAILLIVVAVAVVKNDQYEGAGQPSGIWTLEEASFLGESSMPNSLDQNVVQAVTRRDEATEPIFKCGIHPDD